MKLILGRISSAFIAVAWAVLLGARLVLDLIGYSTAPEDVAVAQTRLEQFIGWLLSVPWWVLLGLAFASTLWLMWVSWPRATPRPMSKNEEPREEAHTQRGMLPQPSSIAQSQDNIVVEDVVAFHRSRIAPLELTYKDIVGYLCNTVLQRRKVPAERELARMVDYLNGRLVRYSKTLAARSNIADAGHAQKTLRDYHEAYLFLREALHRIGQAIDYDITIHHKYDEWIERDHEYMTHLRQLTAYKKFEALAGRLLDLRYSEDYRAIAIGKRRLSGSQSPPST